AEAVDPPVPRGAQGVGEPRDRDHGHDAGAPRPRQHELGDDREQHEADERRDGADLPEVVERLRPRVAQVRGSVAQRLVGREEEEHHRASPVCATDVIRPVRIPGARPKTEERSRVPVRSWIHATIRNSAGTMIPWLTICSTAPCWPCTLRAKMPRTMKPMWLMLE